MSLHISTKERVILLVTVVIGMKCPTAAHTARPVRGVASLGWGWP